MLAPDGGSATLSRLLEMLLVCSRPTFQKPVNIIIIIIIIIVIITMSDIIIIITTTTATIIIIIINETFAWVDKIRMASEKSKY